MLAGFGLTVSAGPVDATRAVHRVLAALWMALFVAIGHQGKAPPAARTRIAGHRAARAGTVFVIIIPALGRVYAMTIHSLGGLSGALALIHLTMFAAPGGPITVSAGWLLGFAA
jgi:hypothetical protein